MEKRIFNKIIKEQMFSYGFEKTGAYDYAKTALDGITKIVIRTPDQISGFGVGAQFVDYGDYSGKSSKVCMAYPEFSLVLCAAASRDYSETQIVEGVKSVIKGIDIYLREGKNAIRDRIDQWVFGLNSDKQKNDIYAYLNLPLIDPYSDSYILKQLNELYKQGGKSMMPLEEYYNHKEHYDKYVNYGCRIDIGMEFVTIAYDCLGSARV